MNTIYVPKGRAKEYGELALNIYKGCSHGCSYCYARKLLRKPKELFIADAKPRDYIETETMKALARGKVGDVELKGKVIHLCFTCDPYPRGADTSMTREIIKMIKASGNHVQILTKNGHEATRDFDLFDENDWFGISFTGYNTQEYEPYAAPPMERISALKDAKKHGLNTWVSCEPVINQADIEDFVKTTGRDVNKIKIGMPNHVINNVISEEGSPMPWGEWGVRIIKICEEERVECYVKEGLAEKIAEYKESFDGQ